MSDASPATPGGPLLDLAGRELRPPANALLGFVELLLASPLAKEQQEYAEMIRLCGEEILHLSGDLLDLAAAGESGAGEAALFEPMAAVRDVAALLEREAAARGIEVSHRSDPALPARVVGAAAGFRRVVLSVLREAFKAVEGTGPVGLEVTVAGLPSAEGFALGFEIRELPPSATLRPGLPQGLGLMLARRLCRALGGGLEAPEAVGPSLPLAAGSIPVGLEPEGAGGGAAGIPIAPDAPASLRILIVEDNPVNQRLLVALLRRLGFASGVALAANGQEALERLRARPFDLVFMDVQMPVMDGFECTRRIRAGEAGAAHAGMRIVAVTAGAMRGDREKCLDSGMDEYLSKPISTASLAAVLPLPPAGN